MGLLSRMAAAVAGGFRADNDKKAPGPADDFWYTPAGSKTGTGIRVTPEIAVKAVAVFTCLKLLAETMAALPFRMHEQLPDGGRKAAPDHPLDELIAFQANDTDTAFDFWTFMYWHMLLRGTGYAEIESNAAGQIEKLFPLHPDRVTPEKIARDRWRYRVRDVDGAERVLLQDEILRIPGLFTGGVKGMGLCETGDEAIAIGMAADQYAARVFSNHLNMGFIVTHPGKLSEEGKSNFIKTFMERAAGIANLHRPILLQEGVKAEKMSMTADEAQLLEARKWQLLEVCRILRIPPHMVGISDGATHSNVEEQAAGFVRYTLLPLGRRTEMSVRRDLIIGEDRRRFVAKYNFDGLLRGAAKDRAEYYAKALGSGGHHPWMMMNEIRALEGLNPLPGGDVIQLPVNTQRRPSENQAVVIEASPAPAALPPPAPATPCTALVQKETKALRKAAMRHAGDIDAWRQYAKAFYGGQVSDVMTRLGVARDVAATYCKARATQCAGAKEPADAINHLERNGAAELAAAMKE